MAPTVTRDERTRLACVGRDADPMLRTYRHPNPLTTREKVLAVAGISIVGTLGYMLFLRRKDAIVNAHAAPVIASDFPWDGNAPGVVAIPLSNPGPLMQGAHYLGKVVVTGLVAVLATPARVQKKATAMGFASVNVYQAGHVPAYFPDVTPAASGDTYWIEGDYVGPSKQQVFPSAVTLTAWYLDYLTHPTVPNLGTYAPSAATASATPAALPAASGT